MGICYQLQKKPKRNFRIPFCVLFPSGLYSERMDLCFWGASVGRFLFLNILQSQTPLLAELLSRIHFIFPKQKPFKIYPRFPAGRSKHVGRRLCAPMEIINQNFCPWRRAARPSLLENVAGNIEDDQEQTSNPDLGLKQRPLGGVASAAPVAFSPACPR